jgi:hypothetical protein
VTFLNTVVNSQCFYVEYLIGLRVKTALISAVYKKSTKLSNTGRKEMTGKVHKSINFLANPQTFKCVQKIPLK